MADDFLLLRICLWGLVPLRCKHFGLFSQINQLFRILTCCFCLNLTEIMDMGYHLLFYRLSSSRMPFIILKKLDYVLLKLINLLSYHLQTLSNEVWWYYNFELGFYLSLIVTQFFDTKRKDFWQMFFHHIVTVLLLSFSWTCNLHRIGSLVMAIHDFADIPLEGAKLCRYVKNQRASNIVFAIFTVCWIYSRIGLLPYRVISYSAYHALFVVPMFPAYYFFNGLLCALQLLHIIWTWLILKITYEAIFNDGVRDIRESDEQSSDSSSSDEDTEVCLINDKTSNGSVSKLKKN